jgi:hypothetical protein
LQDFTSGRQRSASEFLVALLAYLREKGSDWPGTAAKLRDHPLFAQLLRDPCTARAEAVRAGQASRAELIDMVCRYQPPMRGGREPYDHFSQALASGIGAAWRRREAVAQEQLHSALANGKTVCMPGCGMMREADGLAGQDISGLLAIDAEAAAIARIEQVHGGRVQALCADPLLWLGEAADGGARYDLVLAPSLCDGLPASELAATLGHCARLLSPGGRLLLGALTDHPLAAYMEAVMDWTITYHDDEGLAAAAENAGLSWRLFHEADGQALLCEMWFAPRR